MDALPIADQEQRLRAMTWPGGKYHPHFMTGGPWSGSVALAVARRDGDERAASAIEADMTSRLAASAQPQWNDDGRVAQLCPEAAGRRMIQP